MPLFHIQDKQLEMERSVIKFLLENPLSTAEQVFHHTGCGVLGHRFVTHTKIGDVTYWRVNHKKWKAFVNAEGVS